MSAEEEFTVSEFLSDQFDKFCKYFFLIGTGNAFYPEFKLFAVVIGKKESSPNGDHLSELGVNAGSLEVELCGISGRIDQPGFMIPGLTHTFGKISITFLSGNCFNIKKQYVG